MKPTWGIRKLNEYSISKDTAIIITDSEKDNYYWADIPDGSLLVNDKTGNLSIKLTGESDWVPVGIRKDGTDKLVKDAVINVEYYTIVKFELEHNRFYYHDREEITRIGKLIDGKAQFKVGSGLYIPGTNQLEVLINDTVRCNTLDDSLEEINMKYFQIDADDIRLGSTVTVRYINYERLSELYPFIFIQERYPWFFEDKDIWINTAENVSEDGLAITPMSYTVSYPADDPAHAEVTVFTTKKSRLIATHRRDEYFNDVTKRSITKFKVPRKVHDYYLNLFSTYFGYQTNYSKALIKGTQTETDKLTLDAEMLYPNALMGRASVKTQIGSIVTFKRDGKKLYASQNIGMGVQYNLPREEDPYDITVIVRNPSNGLSKEKILTVDRRKIILTAEIDHVTTTSGTEVVVTTLPGSKVTIIGTGPMAGGTIARDVVVGDNGKYKVNIPLAQQAETYTVIVSNDKADNTVNKDIEILLHTPRTPLSVYVVDGKDSLTGDYEGTSALSIQAESGSIIVIKDSSGAVIHTRQPSNLSVEETIYRLPLFYHPEIKTFTVEANKTNKVPESKTITIQGYEKIDAPIIFDVEDPTFEDVPFLGSISYPHFKVQVGSTVVAYDEDNNIVKTHSGKDSYLFSISLPSFNASNAAYYEIKQTNSDKVIKFICTHPLYKTVEVVKTFVGKHLPEYQFELINTYVINPYADMYNSDAYQVLELKLYKTNENTTRTILTIDNNSDIINNLTLSYSDTNAKLAKYTGTNLLEKINGSKNSYLEFYGKNDLSNEEILTVLPKINDYISNAYESNHYSYYFIFKVNNFDDVLHDRTINIKVNGKATNNINIPATILHWSNLEESIHNDPTNKDIFKEDIDLIRPTNYSIYYPEDRNNFIVNKNIKYLHPNLIKLVCVFHNTNPHTKLEALLNKMKEAKYLSNDYEKRYTSFSSNETYFIDGNKFFDTYFKFLTFSSDVILFPSIFSYLYTSAYFHDASFSINYDHIRPKLYLNCNINENNIISVKTNNQDFISNFYKIFEGLNIRRFNSSKEHIESLSSIDLVIKYNGRIIPSFFLGNYYNKSYKNIIIAKNVEEVKDYGLFCNTDLLVFLDYTKIKRFNNMSFINPGIGQGVTVKNINKNNNEILISLSDEDFIEDNIVYKLSDVKNVNNFLVFNKNYPFPAYSSDAFKLKIKAGNSHLKVIDSLFSYAAMESFSIEAKSITLIDEENDIISYDSIPSKERIYGINSDYSSFPKLFRAKYNIPEDIFIYKTNQTVTHFGNSKLKNIDITKFTNYYLYSYEFYGNQNLEKIIFPKHYLVKFGKYTKDVAQCMAYCQAKEIENSDFILSSVNNLGWDAFYSTSKLKTPLNINYIKSFGHSAFSQSNVSEFFYKKRTITNDYLGKEVLIEDGYLESQEKNILFDVTVDNTSFYMTNMSQESFDRIKDNFVNIKADTFFSAKQIKKVVLTGDKLRTFDIGFKNVNLEKFIIDSPSVEAIILEDSFLNNSKLHESAENYKINAPNAKIFLFETKGAYSTLHTINMPNLEYSCIAKPEKRKQFAIKNIAKEKPDIMSRHILDFGGNTNGIDVSYFNNNDSILKSNLEELEMPDHNLVFYAFSNVVDKNNIKIKKLTIYLDALKKIYIGRDVLTGYSYNDVNIIDQNLRNKDFLQNFRWPALEEIIIKNNYGKTEEYNVLGVKIKHVQA